MPLSGPGGGIQIYPKTWSCFWENCIPLVTAGKLTIGTIQSPEFQHNASYDAPAVGDTFAFYPIVDVGTYNFLYQGLKQIPNGIVDLRLNGVSFGTIDLYNGSQLGFHQVLPIEVTEAGEQEITVVVTGKNAAASNYYSGGARVSLTKT